MNLNEQLAGMVAPHSPLDAAMRQLMEAWSPYKGERGGTGWQNEAGRVAYVKDMPGSGGSKDLFGEPVKPGPGKPDEIKSLGGRQQNLFGKRGLPGQMSLFADAGVPDDMVAKPATVVPPKSPPLDAFEYPSDPDFSMNGSPERIKRPSSGKRQVRQLVKDGVANPKAAEPILRALVGDDEFVETVFQNNYAKTPVDRLSALIDMAALELERKREKANPQSGRYAEVSQEEGVLFGSGMRNYVSVEDENEINKTIWDALRGVDRLGVLSADSPKIGEQPANIPVEQGPGGPVGGEQTSVEGNMDLEGIKAVMSSGKSLVDSSNEINRLTQGMTDEQAVEAGRQLGLPNVAGVWTLKNAVLGRSEEVFARGEAEKWGLVGQPKKRVAGQNLPVASPNNIRYRTMDGLKQQLKAKFVTRAPSDGEAVVTVERPQRANQFVEYRPGDVISGRGGLRFVVQAAKDGYTRAGEGWKRWEQTLVVRMATPEDIEAVSSQQAAQDAKGKRLMDNMMAS